MPMPRRCVIVGAALFMCASSLRAQNLPAPRPPVPVFTGQDVAAVNATIDRFGFDFMTVGAPGNRSWIESERRYPNGWNPNHIDDRGRVDYEYRILRTEVVQTQYVDFVRAFQPFWLSIEAMPGTVESGSPTDSNFTSRGIEILGGFEVDPRYDNSAVTISWRNAARYTNWLHNGAPTDQPALTWDTFHTGAYTFTDESFGSNIRGNPVTRNDDARFWLPSLDELLKAAYYDPDRYGEGEEGYWKHPHSSNEQPVRGVPGEGDYGAGDDEQAWEWLTAGRYPDTVSPWGLLDVLGTEEGWTETPYGVALLNGVLVPNGDRVLVGQGFAEIDQWNRSTGTGIGFTFRLATIVPGPGSALALSMLGALALPRRRRTAVVCAAATLCASASLARDQDHLRFTTQHGLTFSEIGDPGNKDFVFERLPGDTRVFGGVDHRYRVATTEVTSGQWFEFLGAFARHVPTLGLPVNDSALTGGSRYLGSDSEGVPFYQLPSEVVNNPARVGWRYAARYVNWLHNGAPTGSDVPLEVFQNGAYDATTFTENPDGTYNDQRTRKADARFWIPTQDEWNKAAYYDPDRYGDGEGGYWLYPNSSDERLVPGAPQDGGETNFGVSFDDAPNMTFDASQYTDQRSPWGLLDISGGGREWTEDVDPFQGPKWRTLAGTMAGMTELVLTRGDHIGWVYGDFQPVVFSTGVLRVAAAIPSPGVVSTLALVGALALPRRRR